MSTPNVQHDGPRPPDQDGAHSGRTLANWVLAGLAVVGAFAVVGFAYLKVLGTAACTDKMCGDLGPSELVFSLILYGTPVVAIVGVLVSFLSARHRLGIFVPVCVWAVIAVAVVILVVTF
jgi:hypothetical protein